MKWEFEGLALTNSELGELIQASYAVRDAERALEIAKARREQIRSRLKANHLMESLPQ